MNIKELAKKLNVSSSTISRVLNKQSGVSKLTRVKVLEGIKKYNYIPSSVARNLSSKTTKNIGVIVPDIQNQFFSDMMAGVSEIATKYNFNIFYLGTNEEEVAEHKALDTMLSEHIAGVIITPVNSSDMVSLLKLKEIEATSAPVVLVDRDLLSGSFSGVFVDNIKGSSEAVGKLLDLGHRNIAIITGPKQSKPGSERLLGYMDAFNKRGFKVNNDYIVEGDFKIDKAYEQTSVLMSKKIPPTAIFCSNNQTSLGAIKYLTEHKYNIGHDISIIGFDDLPILEYIGYNFSAILRDSKLQGSLAMKMVLEQLQNKEIKKKHINVPHSLILRGSEKFNF